MDMSESEDETKNSEEMIEELQRLREQPAILGQHGRHDGGVSEVSIDSGNNDGGGVTGKCAG